MRHMDRPKGHDAKCRDLISHVNAYQRGSTTHTKKIINKENRRTQIVDVSKTLSLAALVLVQWAYEWSSHSGKELPLASECLR